MQVKEIVRIKGNTLWSVTPGTLLSEAVVSMADHDIGSVVVMEAGRLSILNGGREAVIQYHPVPSVQLREYK